MHAGGFSTGEEWDASDLETQNWIASFEVQQQLERMGTWLKCQILLFAVSDNKTTWTLT